MKQWNNALNAFGTANKSARILELMGFIGSRNPSKTMISKEQFSSFIYQNREGVREKEKEREEKKNRVRKRE